MGPRTVPHLIEVGLKINEPTSTPRRDFDNHVIPLTKLLKSIFIWIQIIRNHGGVYVYKDLRVLLRRPPRGGSAYSVLTIGFFGSVRPRVLRLRLELS